jgi:hypothetical protein
MSPPQISSLEFETHKRRCPSSEINEMFAKRVPARKWSGYRCDIAEYAGNSYRHSTLPGDQGDDLEKKVAGGAVDERVEKV